VLQVRVTELLDHFGP